MSAPDGPDVSLPSTQDIQRASDVLAEHVRTTPVLSVDGRDFGVSASIHLKLEFLQVSGTFKGRGATHFMATQPISSAGVVAASGGNHGAAVAWAAQRLGHEANIFVPTISAPAKVDRLASYGAIVHQIGDVYGESLEAARAFESETGATSIHAYNDPVVIAGAGTCALEFDEQVPDLDAVLLACGGGGLSAGAACWFQDQTEIVVCETATTQAYAAAVEAGSPTDVEVGGIAADALGATQIGALPWQALRRVSATSALVDDDAVVEAKRRLWEDLRIVVEPSAAVPLAALLTGAWTPRSPTSRVGIVVCGANTTLA